MKRLLILAGWICLGVLTALNANAARHPAAPAIGCGASAAIPTDRLPTTIDASKCSPGYVRIAGLRVGDTLHLSLGGHGVQLTIYTTLPSGVPQFADGVPGGLAICQIAGTGGGHTDCQVPAAGIYLLESIGKYSRVSVSVTHFRATVGLRHGSCSAAQAPSIGFAVTEFGIGNLCALSQLFYELPLKAGDRIVVKTAQGPNAAAGFAGSSSGVMVSIFPPGTTDLNINTRSPICSGGSDSGGSIRCHARQTGAYLVAFSGLGDFTIELAQRAG